MAPSETSPKKPRLRRQSRRSNGACPNLLLRVHKLAEPLPDLEDHRRGPRWPPPRPPPRNQGCAGKAGARTELVQTCSYVFTSSRSRLPTLKNGTRFSGTLTASPVLGFRPLREFRCRIRKLPKPRSSTLSPLLRASVMLSKTVLTISSVSFFVRLASLATSSINSALVMSRLPPKGDHAAPGSHTARGARRPGHTHRHATMGGESLSRRLSS